MRLPLLLLAASQASALDPRKLSHAGVSHTKAADVLFEKAEIFGCCSRVPKTTDADREALLPYGTGLNFVPLDFTLAERSGCNDRDGNFDADACPDTYHNSHPSPSLAGQPVKVRYNNLGGMGPYNCSGDGSGIPGSPSALNAADDDMMECYGNHPAECKSFPYTVFSQDTCPCHGALSTNNKPGCWLNFQNDNVDASKAPFNPYGQDFPHPSGTLHPNFVYINNVAQLEDGTIVAMRIDNVSEYQPTTPSVTRLSTELFAMNQRPLYDTSGCKQPFDVFFDINFVFKTATDLPAPTPAECAARGCEEGCDRVTEYPLCDRTDISDLNCNKNTGKFTALLDDMFDNYDGRGNNSNTVDFRAQNMNTANLFYSFFNQQTGEP